MIQEIPIKSLILDDKNPRKITKDDLEKLCESISSDPDFLHNRPVLVNKKDEKFYVYAGNQRVRAVKKLKRTTIPCYVEENLSDAIIKKRILIDNQHNGDWDWDILANNYDVEDLLAAGFSADDLVGAVQNIDVEKLTGSKDTEDDKKCKMCPACGYEL